MRKLALIGLMGCLLGAAWADQLYVDGTFQGTTLPTSQGTFVPIGNGTVVTTYQTNTLYQTNTTELTLYTDTNTFVLAQQDGQANLQVTNNDVVLSTPDSTNSILPQFPLYPVFCLDLGGPWTDFILKGSTNNFLTLQYMVTSSPGVTAHVSNDSGARVWFLDDYGVSPFVYQLLTGSSIFAQMADPVNGVISAAIVSPSRNTPRTWMDPRNPNLVWAYCRVSSTAMEQNATQNNPNQLIPNDATHWIQVTPTWEYAQLSP